MLSPKFPEHIFGNPFYLGALELAIIYWRFGCWLMHLHEGKGLDTNRTSVFTYRLYTYNLYFIVVEGKGGED